MGCSKHCREINDNNGIEDFSKSRKGLKVFILGPFFWGDDFLGDEESSVFQANLKVEDQQFAVLQLVVSSR